MISSHCHTSAVNTDHFIPQWVSENAFRRHGIEIRRAQGVYMFDSDGRRVIDFFSQVMATSLGHGLPILADAMQKQAKDVAFLNTIKFVHPVVHQYCKKLAGLLPDSINRIFFTVSGAESTETAIKVARQFTGRQKVLYRERSYHGASYGALSVSGDARQKIIDGYTLPYAVCIPHFGNLDDMKDLATNVDAYIKRVEDIIKSEGPESIACLVIETVTGGSGMFMPPTGLFQRLRSLVDHYGILLIADEVMTGFGRTGTMWAFEQENYTPDIVTMAKGINNGVCPLGAVAISDHIAAYYKDRPFPHGATNSTHLVSIAAANATLDYIVSNRVVEGVAEREAILRARLKSLCDKGAAKGFRLRGLMGAIVLNPTESKDSSGALFMDNASLLDALYNRGLYTLIRGDLILMGPPLTISERELHEAMDALEDVLLRSQSRKVYNAANGIDFNANQAQMWDDVTVEKWRATTKNLGYVYNSAVTYVRNLVRRPENALILEIGSGTGEMISQFQGVFGSCWGVEYQGHFAKACKASYPDLNIIQGDAKELSQLIPADFATDANEVLFICLTNTLGNMSSSDMCKIVNEMVSMLPDRGEVVLGFTAKKHFDSVVRGVFQENPGLFGEVSRNDATGEISTSSGYYSKLYDLEELVKLLGDGWRFETVDKTIYCHFVKPTRKAQLYYDDKKNFDIHTVLGNNEMHVGLYSETPQSRSTDFVDRTVMVEAEQRATNKLLDMAHINPQTIVADFGSGFGNTANLAFSRATAPDCYYGIDISVANIDVARKVNASHSKERIQFLQCDFSDTGLPDESVDVVISQDSLLHATAVMDRVLREAFRILKPGGRLVFTDIMQSPDIQFSASLADRLGIKSLCSPQSYKELAHQTGFLFSHFEDMSHNLKVHYSSFQNQVRSIECLDKETAAYIDLYKQGLQVWVDASDDLRWGFMRFMKLPPNCRRIEYPWVHFFNCCADNDVNERFRIRTELAPDVKPKETVMDKDGFTIHWSDTGAQVRIKFGIPNEFFEDVIFWAVDAISPNGECISCWVTNVFVGKTKTSPIPSLLSTVSHIDESLDFVQFDGAKDEHFQKLTEAGLLLQEMPVTDYSFLNRSSKNSAIGWHTDNAFYYETPQFVCLFGEVVEESAEEATITYFADSRLVIERMKQKHAKQYKLLKSQPLYMARAINSQEHDMTVSIIPRKIINDNGDVFLSGITQRVPSQLENSAAMYEALKTLEQLCEEFRFPIKISQGEGVIFNNQRYIHCRSLVKPGRIIKYTSFHAPMLDKFGVIGLGTMGMPLCNRLAALSTAGTVNGKCGGFDIDLAQRGKHLAPEITRHDSVENLCKEADTVFLFLPDECTTKSCVQEIIKTSGPRERLVINMGTTSPECTRQLQDLLSSEGHLFCEAPVSGCPAAVAKGQVTIMFACHAAVYERAAAVLRLLSQNVIFCGAIGSANMIKLCNNFCVAGNMLSFSIAGQAAKKFGCSESLLSRILNQATGRSWCSEVHNPIPGVVRTAPGSNNYRPGFRANYMSKDVGLFSDAAEMVGMKTPFVNYIDDVYRSLQSQHSDLDFSSIYKHVAVSEDEFEAA